MTDEVEPLSTESREHVARLGLVFLSEYYETALRHRPGNLEALAELAHVYTRLGRVQEGLAVDRKLAELEPENPTVHYNLACSLALSGAKSAALDALERAAKLGYTDGEFLQGDEDLEALRSEPRFQELVARLKSAG